jgi:septum formation protein
VKVPPLVLASASPRRHALLADLKLPFVVQISDVLEVVEPGVAPRELAMRLAAQKAEAVAGSHDYGLVLGADTIVVLDGEILGKPRDEADAARMLRRLSGREHEVITGVALVDAETGETHQSAVTSRVCFRRLRDKEIAAYVVSGEPLDKAGAYAIQGVGGRLLAGFTGCHANIVGLPICEVAALLETAGLAIPPAAPGCRLPDGGLCPRQV